MKPKVVCLCGSTRFRKQFQECFYQEEHEGKICLTVPCYKDDTCCKSEEDWKKLDELHKHKIDFADEILVIDVRLPQCQRCGNPCKMVNSIFSGQISNCCGSTISLIPYIGSSTDSEIQYAMDKGKKVRYYSQEIVAKSKNV